MTDVSLSAGAGFVVVITGNKDVLGTDPVFVLAHQKLWIAYALQGNKEEAVHELGNVFLFFGHDDLAEQIKTQNTPVNFKAVLQSYIDSGYLTDYEKARLQSLLNEKEEALQSLRRAAADGSGWMTFLGVEPAFDPLHDSREYQGLFADAHIPNRIPTR